MYPRDRPLFDISAGRDPLNHNHQSKRSSPLSFGLSKRAFSGTTTMRTISRDGVALAYTDSCTRLPSMLLVHGWGCDHTVLSAQKAHFARSYRVVSVDLRGHGESASPENEYSMASFADDLAWLCRQIELPNPVIIGHGMGGAVALEAVSRYRHLSSAVVMLQTTLFPPQAWLNSNAPSAEEALAAEDHVAVFRSIIAAGFIASDDQVKRANLTLYLPRAPRHVLLSSFIHSVSDYDAVPAAIGCQVPIAYIGGTNSIADVFHFKALTPQLVVGQMVGAGYFAPVFAPDQVNTMIASFLKEYVGRI
jgi:pimeloyl-ACP methyl ester carboxylesterase